MQHYLVNYAVLSSSPTVTVTPGMGAEMFEFNINFTPKECYDLIVSKLEYKFTDLYAVITDMKLIEQ